MIRIPRRSAWRLLFDRRQGFFAVFGFHHLVITFATQGVFVNLPERQLVVYQ